jgi:hypothetical protein
MRILKEHARRLKSFSFSQRIRTENDPIKLKLTVLSNQAQNRPAAADLNVIAMRSETKNSTQWSF